VSGRHGKRLLAVVLPLALSNGPAPAGGDAARTGPSPIPEPIVAESITNIDGTQAGELEFDAETVLLHRGSLGSSVSLAVETEWRATRQLGLALETSVGKAGSGQPVVGRVEAGLSWALFHDLARDLHVQAEATARFGEHGEENDGPTEPPHPVTVGLRAALRSGALTVRVGAGANFGDGAAAFAQLAVLREFGGAPARGFAGIELNTNIGAGAPLTVVPQVFVTVPVFGAPVDVGFGVPWSPGLRGGEPAAIGGILRVVFEP
jgi:hypothetical protein